MVRDRRNPLLEVFREPSVAGGFTPDDWNLLLRQAKREKLVARLGTLLDDHGLAAIAPERLSDTVRAARAYVGFQHGQIRRELRRLTQALGDIDVEPILLKGAAYLEAGLPHSRGRHMSDIDILVPERGIPAIENRLLQRGWESQKLDAYDQRYYRQWMHEIPPLRHPEHGIEIDIHHALLPLTARVRPKPELLRAASIPLAGRPYRILCPVDMLLHTAAHLFYDGEIAESLRELIDLHQMLQHFGKDARFWSELTERAERQELRRPLYYALHFCTRLLASPVPSETLERTDVNGAPGGLPSALMDLLATRVLLPKIPGERRPHISALLLYVRSHWLRMPPWLLAQHLTRKAWRRARGARAEP